MRRGENQNTHNKKQQSRGGVREEQDCGAQDSQQVIHAGYERSAGMEKRS